MARAGKTLARATVTFLLRRRPAALVTKLTGARHPLLR